MLPKASDERDGGKGHGYFLGAWSSWAFVWCFGEGSGCEKGGTGACNRRINSAAAKLVPVTTVVITAGSYCLKTINTANPKTIAAAISPAVIRLIECLA
ncbi:hypothetical protein GCM10010185_11590 [Saccharothrix coeruleofusca]|uniref:Uncharacterized protein n=1 Tax=Saccharothrix coeruleofusca TaxID=33919 RepID=A0A918AKP1_9PSEU|nr:hypothetical protein GCM10010185_11590 [Saccharothrix coeruleofusca]